MVSTTLKRVIGILFVIVGIIAFALPVVPGALLLFIGMELLGLSFLLPRPVRTRWDTFKVKMIERWERWRGKKKGFWRRSWMF